MTNNALESFSHLASGARRIAADPARNLALRPQPGRITHLFSHTPTRQQVGKLLVG